MKINIVYLLLIALLGITVSASIAQQNQNVPKTDTEVEALQKRVSELENKLQTVENVEKMELAAKLAEAQAKLSEAEFDKLKLELKDSNEKWLLGWIGFLGVMFAVFGVVIWSRLTKKMDDLIATEVEKSLTGFQEAVKQVNILKDELRVLEKEHAATVLEGFIHSKIGDEHSHPEEIKVLREDVLLEIFGDKTRYFSNQR